MSEHAVTKKSLAAMADEADQIPSDKSGVGKMWILLAMVVLVPLLAKLVEKLAL